MIRYVETSIMRDIPDYSVILHQVNCTGVVQPGISSQVCKNYPGWFQDYHWYCKWFEKKPSELLGSFHRFPIEGKHLIVCSAFCQEKAGKYSTETDLNAWKKVINNIFRQTKFINSKYGTNWEIHIQENIGANGKDNVNDDLLDMFDRKFSKAIGVNLIVHERV